MLSWDEFDTEAKQTPAAPVVEANIEAIQQA
jgi:hypothetical protein